LQAFRFGASFAGRFIVLLVIADVIVAIICAFDPSFAQVEGPLEVFQLVVLGFAAVSFLAVIPRVEGAAQFVASGAAALCTLFFFREFESPGDNPVLIFISHDRFLYIITALMGLAIAVQFYRHRAHIPAFLMWLVRIEWWPILIAGLFLLVGEVAERKKMEPIEETLELNGYLIFAAVAVSAWLTAGRRTALGGSETHGHRPLAQDPVTIMRER
jgi:hypothetical protein